MTKATTQRTLRFQQVVHTVNSIFSRAKENKTKKGQLNKKKKDTPHYITRKTKSKPVALLQYIFFWSVL